MLIILISFAFLIIGGLGWFIAERKHKHWEELQRKYREKGYRYSHSSPERKELEENEERCRVNRNRWGTASMWLFGAFIVGIIAVLICCLIMMTQCLATAERVELEETYIALHQDIVMTHDGNPPSCDALTKQIEYNTKIRNGRRYNNNPWINWFVPNYYDELPLFSQYGGIHPLADWNTNDGISWAINQYDFIAPNQ